MEHAVLIHIPLDDSSFGSEGAREALLALEDELTAAIEMSGSGEFDGNDFGSGECIFYAYGPDADDLYKAVEGILKQSNVAKGATPLSGTAPQLTILRKIA